MASTWVKEESPDENPMDEFPPPPPVQSSSSSSRLLEDSILATIPPGLPPMDLDSDMEEEEDDEEPLVYKHQDDEEEDEEEDDDNVIVREIDVYLSPELANKLHLIQFPLQRQPPALHNKHTQDQPDRPQAARIKPQHCMIELEYTTNTETHQDYNGQFALSKRIFASQTIPVSTHMALGKMVISSEGTGEAVSGLHLVPLTRIMQMRPSFHHVNEATMDLSSSEDMNAMHNPPSSSLDGAATRRPLPFQKKESERAALARKSSYAFKKVSEDSEVWIPLEVHDPDSAQSDEIMKQVRCPAPTEKLLLGPAIAVGPSGGEAAGPGTAIPIGQVTSNQHVVMPQQVPSSASSSLSLYVQSLNYLPQSFAGSKTELAIDETGTRPDIVVTTVTKMVELMHQGWPMPYSILRAQFDRSTYSDEVLIQALSSCAFLIRGNFILQSRLLPLPTAVGQARTFILLMLQSVGVVHRKRLEYVYQGDDQVTPEVLLMLLQQVATRTSVGWKAKVEDDDTFENNFPEAVPIYLEFWKRQVRRFSGLVERYRQVLTAAQENGSSRMEH